MKASAARRASGVFLSMFASTMATGISICKAQRSERHASHVHTTESLEQGFLRSRVRSPNKTAAHTLP
jgi:hypothetical protein